MEIDTWIGGCKVRGFPWIDDKTYYLNVQYFLGGSSVYRPQWEKRVFITLNDRCMDILRNHLDTLIEFVRGVDMNKSGEILLTF